MLSVPEKILHGTTAAEHQSFARKHFSLFGAVVAVHHICGEHVEDNVVEVEYAGQAFLEHALLKEVVSGVYPTQVINQLDPLMPIAMVKVLSVSQEATSQDLHNALIHYGSI